MRDLGYFVLESLENIVNKGIFLVSKLRYGTNLYHLTTGKKLDLLKILKKQNHFDDWVLIGLNSKLKVRLVAEKVHPEIALSRRKRARTDRNQKINHGKHYYQLLQYSIYITNIPLETASSDHICRLYAMRWRIESIFKCWKSVTT